MEPGAYETMVWAKFRRDGGPHMNPETLAKSLKEAREKDAEEAVNTIAESEQFQKFMRESTERMFLYGYCTVKENS